MFEVASLDAGFIDHLRSTSYPLEKDPRDSQRHSSWTVTSAAKSSNTSGHGNVVPSSCHPFRASAFSAPLRASPIGRLSTIRSNISRLAISGSFPYPLSLSSPFPSPFSHSFLLLLLHLRPSFLAVSYFHRKEVLLTGSRAILALLFTHTPRIV